MRRLAAPLALLVFAALPADAMADIRFRGKSGQGRAVTLRTGDDGLVERFAIRWRAPCRRPGFFFRTGTQTTPASPFEEHTRDRFVDVGGYRTRIENGLRAVFRARTVGNRVSERRWRGIFRITVRVLRGDRLIDRCHLGTRWRVLRSG
jgi:hypothetical protein